MEIFKKHIRLYDKGAGLLFPEDVKRYFSNYIAAGSVTCRTLRETLLKELENTVDKDVNRFESVVDGGERIWDILFRLMRRHVPMHQLCGMM